MRKIWKRELEGLSERQQVAKLEEILHHELGMEGRPTLEKCKAIRAQREFKEELQALDPKNVLPTKLRSRRGEHPKLDDDGETASPASEHEKDARNGHENEDADTDDLFPPPARPKLDLSALGDPEAD